MTSHKLTIKDILKQRTPTQRSVSLILDGSLRDQIVLKRREVAQARLTDDGSLASPVARLEEELAALQAEAEEGRVVFTFEAIGRAEFEALQADAPPTKEQQADGFGFNPDAFGPPLLAACAVEPEISVNEARIIWDEWSQGDVNALWEAAYGVNVEARITPFGSGSVLTRDSGQNSDTASL